MKNFCLYAIIVCTITSISCERAGTSEIVPVTSDTQTALFKVEDGRAVFKSSDDFTKQIKFLSSINQPDLTKWSQEADFTSLYDVKLQRELSQTTATARQSANDDDLSDAVEDPYFASLLNKDGELIIGSALIRVTPDLVFIGQKRENDKADKNTFAKMRQKDKSKYKDVKPSKYVVDDGIVVGKVQHLPQIVSTSHARASLFGITHTIFDWDGTHRSATVIYNDNWLIYKSLGCKVKFQNKRWWGGWWEANVDDLRLDYTVTYDISTWVGYQQFVKVKPIKPMEIFDKPVLEKIIDFNVASVKVLGDPDDPRFELIDSPYNFTEFEVFSFVAWYGVGFHDDYLYVTQ